MMRLVSTFALAILLLLLATLGDTYNHHYRVHGKITCPRKWFWYWVELHELDVSSSDDLFGSGEGDSFYPHYYNHTWTGENSDELTAVS
ncbi:hypothetical protein B9Z55_021984 [Caenorhabditis nigoni]|uniref:Uncharacterized protein n=1 Tax=Caenorhabditis nigoni TaxID=1611254 RepID=A0A2G5TUE1_9PELO|nr:hypothetical protein B9Z55_021984 [Caenorhabditis nigoni]